SPCLPRYVYGIISRGKISDLLVYIEHLAVPADDSRKTRKLTKPEPEVHHLGYVAESGENADKGPRLIIHAGYRHLDPAHIATTGSNVYSVGVMSQLARGLAAKGAFIPAERRSEYEMAIFAQHF